MTYLRVFFLCIGLLAPFSLSAQSKPLITVGYYDFPPVSYTNSEGSPAGSTLKLCELLLKQQGYAVAFKALPSARLYAQLISGEVDLWLGSAGKPELSGHVLEGSQQLNTATLALFYHPSAPPPQLPDDLHNKKIILINGYSYWSPAAEWLTDPSLNLNITRTSKHTSAIAMLMRKRGDYLLNYVTPIQHTMRQLGIAELQMPYVSIHSVPITFIISKNSAYAEQLLKDLETAYKDHNPSRLYQHNR
ncbi:MAG: amino acid ABC transporter substrate-binding protein [Gammaproteobacteria bacterium]|nr:amino acid ABC transporter substrate-binding protein [Gammaproteobacteria bacterium]